MARPPRLPGFDYIGPYRYFVTFCVRDRRAVFRDARTAALAVSHFRHTARASDFAILAYCLMPDHAHLLVEGLSSRSDFRYFARRAKQSSGQAYALRAGARLWQDGYYERVLRAGDDAKEVARYVVANPVRAGLVEEPAEYPHLGSDVWTLEELLDSID